MGRDWEDAALGRDGRNDLAAMVCQALTQAMRMRLTHTPFPRSTRAGGCAGCHAQGRQLVHEGWALGLQVVSGGPQPQGRGRGDPPTRL